MARRWEYDRIVGATWEELNEQINVKDDDGWDVVGFAVIDAGFQAFLRRKHRPQEKPGRRVGFARVEHLV
jgi:hypothetical protein